MAYLNPNCAKCMQMNGWMWRNYCRARLHANLCPNGYYSRYKREIVVIQDLQKMPRTKYHKIKTHIPYQNTWYF